MRLGDFTTRQILGWSDLKVNLALFCKNLLLNISLLCPTNLFTICILYAADQDTVKIHTFFNSSFCHRPGLGWLFLLLLAQGKWKNEASTDAPPNNPVLSDLVLGICVLFLSNLIKLSVNFWSKAPVIISLVMQARSNLKTVKGQKSMTQFFMPCSPLSVASVFPGTHSYSCRLFILCEICYRCQIQCLYKIQPSCNFEKLCLQHTVANRSQSACQVWNLIQTGISLCTGKYFLEQSQLNAKSPQRKVLVRNLCLVIAVMDLSLTAHSPEYKMEWSWYFRPFLLWLCCGVQWDKTVTWVSAFTWSDLGFW